MQRSILFLIFLTVALTIHIDHTASPPTVDLTAFRNAQLAKHNTYRAKHGTPSLVLDANLNSVAQAYADALAANHSLVHSAAAQAGKYGENLYWGWGSPTLTYSLGKASDSWYNEIAYYDYTTGKSTTSGKVVGHFTAMIWKGVTSVGFGFASVAENNGFAVYVVANYSPTPNIVGQYPQNVPKPI